MLDQARCGSRIWSRGVPASEADSCRRSEVESHVAKRAFCGRGPGPAYRALEAFGFLMLKYAFSHILETLFPLFLTSILTPKVDKNRALDFSFNKFETLLDVLHLFFNLSWKSYSFNWMTWGMPSEVRLKILWHGWWKIDQLCEW